MGESGSSSVALTYPIIERRDLQTPRQHVIYGTLTLVFWIFWIYLWVPVLALAAWLIGIREAYIYMVALGGYHALLDLLAFYSITIALLAGSLLVWATYNILRFRNKPRNGRAAVKPEKVAEDLGHETDELTRWRESWQLYVSHDEEGRIKSVETAAPPAPAAA